MTQKYQPASKTISKTWPAVCIFFVLNHPRPGLGVVTRELWPGSELRGRVKTNEQQIFKLLPKILHFKQRGTESANKQETLQGFVVQGQGIVQTNVSHVILKQSGHLHGLPSQHWGVRCLIRSKYYTEAMSEVLTCTPSCDS